jgi:hypothetical protein
MIRALSCWIISMILNTEVSRQASFRSREQRACRDPFTDYRTALPRVFRVCPPSVSRVFEGFAVS